MNLNCTLLIDVDFMKIDPNFCEICSAQSHATLNGTVMLSCFVNLFKNINYLSCNQTQQGSSLFSIIFKMPKKFMTSATDLCRGTCGQTFSAG